MDVDFTGLVTGISDRQVEIMRGELAAILHGSTRDDVEYLFGASIRNLAQDDGGVDVLFEPSAPRLWVPATAHVAPDLLPRHQLEPSMIRRWR